MNKRKLIIGLWSSVIFASLTSGLLASVAWFATANDVKVAVTGSVVEEYFHCGNGSEQDPFVITRPIHYYHLVEFFQRETILPLSQNIEECPHFGSDYLYFQIGYDLDNDGDLEVFSYDDQGIYQGTFESPVYSNTLNMAYYSGTNALMPIGTNEVPFIGSFDGKANQGISISNINIHCSETVLVGNTSTVRTASDIGIFGYVSDTDGDQNNPTATVIKNAKFDGVTIDLTGVTSTVASSTTGITHVDAHAGKAYVGYIAGHVHTYTNYDSGVNASPLYNVYVDNAKIQGGPGVYCNYGYIGLVDSIDDEQTTPTVAGEIGEINNGGGTGQGDDWGGSIDMLSLNKRIRGLINKNKEIATRANHTDIVSGHAYQSNRKYHRYYYDGETSITTYDAGNTTYYDGNPETTSIVYRLEGNSTSSKDGTSNSSSNETFSVPGTYIPISADESTYQVNNNNTGYIAAGSLYTTTSLRTASYAISNVGLSMSPYNTSSSSYDSSTLEVLSNSTVSYNSSNFKRINNGNSGNTGAVQNYDASINPDDLYGYAKAYSDTKSILNNAKFVQGLHFTGTAINSSKTISVPTAHIGKNSYNNYPVLQNSIDFNLKQSGAIRFFAGSYGTYNSTVDCDSFFSLFTVQRNASNAITSASQIFYIYENTNTTTKAAYPYIYYGSNNTTLIEAGYTSSQVTKGNLVFDMGWLHNAPPVLRAIYYFQIPVNPGEYAMGTVENKTHGAYLLYLDISANGAQTEATVNESTHIDNSPLFTQIGFLKPSDSFILNSCFNVEYIVPSGATKETFSITISCGSDENHPGYTCYEIVIVNTSGSNFVLNALLMDNDNNPDNAYTYMYAIKYNTGNRVTYTGSNTYTGASGGTSMTPTYGS